MATHRHAPPDDPGHPIADFSVNALAFLFAGALAVLVSVRVDETELLVGVGLVATLTLRVVAAVAQFWFRANDGRIDAFERYWLYLLNFVVWLGYYFTVQSALLLFYELTRAWPLPTLLEALLALAVLLVAAVALVPRFSSFVAVEHAHAARDAHVK